MVNGWQIPLKTSKNSWDWDWEMLIDHVVQVRSASSSFAFSTQQSTQQSIAGWCPTPLGYLGGCLGHSGNLGLVVGFFFLCHSSQISQATQSLLSKKLPKENIFHTFSKQSDAFRLNILELILLPLSWLNYNYCSSRDESSLAVVYLLEYSVYCT